MTRFSASLIFLKVYVTKEGIGTQLNGNSYFPKKKIFVDMDRNDRSRGNGTLSFKKTVRTGNVNKVGKKQV